MADFKDLLTLPALHTYVKEEGFRYPTKVQATSIPRLISGKSVSVLAQTGSGKTLAYALPIAELLKKHEENADTHEPLVRSPVAWVLCPTIELGSQVEQVFKSIAHRAKLRIRHVKKGDSPKQKRASMAGSIDVIIGSPSRLLGALESGELKPDAASFVILDEADLLFEPDFLPDVQAVISTLSSPELQVGLFSATMPSNFSLIRKESFPGIKFDEVKLQGTHTLRDNIATTNHTVPFKDKLQHTVGMLKELRGPGFLFVNLKRTAEEVYEHLSEKLPNKEVHLLHGGVEKRQRRRALKEFLESGDVLVCTDIVSRGIDLREMKWVLNYDLPFEPVYYIHRCGRVGRRGEPARVFNLVTTKDFPLIARINDAIANQGSLKLSRIVGQTDPARGRSAGTKKRKSSGGKPSRGKSAGGKPGRGKATGGRPTSGNAPAGRRGRAQATEGRPTTGKAQSGKPSRGKATGGRPTSGNAPAGRRGRGQATEGRPTTGNAPSGRSSRGKATGGRPTSGNAPTGRRGRGQASGGRPAKGKSSGRKPPASSRGKGR